MIMECYCCGRKIKLDDKAGKQTMVYGECLECTTTCDGRYDQCKIKEGVCTIPKKTAR